jgi:ferritin-like protein
MTYTSNSTEQIQKAYNILINNAYEIYPRSFKQLEDILACKGSQIDANCKKAIANLIKITGVRMLETIGMYHKTDDDWTNKHRKLLHVV